MTLPPPLIEALRSIVRCPRCGGSLTPRDADVECTHCSVCWPVDDGVLDLLSPIEQEASQRDR